uniref:Uncharacterized protein n=1 Tax=Anguilla anguilla TaxID=7936 RepID=A0A0E9XQD2_ANGAN
MNYNSTNRNYKQFWHITSCQPDIIICFLIVIYAFHCDKHHCPSHCQTADPPVH